MNNAGSALRCIATDVSAGELKMITDKLDQKSAFIDIAADPLAIDDH